jgi:hypothetical protein
VQRIDKDSLVNIKKLHAPSAGMKCTFDAVCIIFGPAPHRVEGAVPGLNDDNYWLEDVLLLNDVQFVKNMNSFKIETLKPSRTGPEPVCIRNRTLWAVKWKIANASFASVAALYDFVCAAFDE